MWFSPCVYACCPMINCSCRAGAVLLAAAGAESRVVYTTSQPRALQELAQPRRLEPQPDVALLAQLLVVVGQVVDDGDVPARAQQPGGARHQILRPRRVAQHPRQHHQVGAARAGDLLRQPADPPRRPRAAARWAAPAPPPARHSGPAGRRCGRWRSPARRAATAAAAASPRRPRRPPPAPAPATAARATAGTAPRPARPLRPRRPARPHPRRPRRRTAARPPRAGRAAPGSAPGCRRAAQAPGPRPAPPSITGSALAVRPQQRPRAVPPRPAAAPPRAAAGSWRDLRLALAQQAWPARPPSAPRPRTARAGAAGPRRRGDETDRREESEQPPARHPVYVYLRISAICRRGDGF